MSKREYERVPLSEDELLERRDVNSRRARLGLACGVAFCVGAVAYVVTNPTLPPAKRLAAASVTGEVTYHELLEIDSVCSWIEAWEGVDDCTSLAEAKVLKYVPRKMTTSYDADLVEKAVGSAASDGYLAFNLIYEDASGSLTSSWLVAMAYDGTVRTMTPLYEGDALHRAAGLKMWDDDELLLAVGKDTSLDGYAYKWNWRSGDYAKYSTKEIDIHDVQRANSGASFWALYHEEFAKVSKEGDLEVGWNAVEHTPSDDVWDLNHVQLIEEEDYAILSSRLTNAIYKVKAATGAKVWALGGDDGTFEVTDIDGKVYAAGESAWHGQHNAEYIGDDEYAMFDNNYDFSSKESRLLIVKIDEAAKTANVTFDYSTGTYSQVFGDNDRMPTGNMLGCWWPSHTVTADDDACCKVQEVDRSTSGVAFELQVYGKKTCESGTCDVEEGWLMYSVERFYEDPMVYDVDCGAERLSFATANTHKMASDSYGTYKLYDASGAYVAYGDVTWKPHWQRSVVDVDYAISNSGTIEVENQYGSAGTWTFTC